MKTTDIHQVDAFTDQLFGGNPAGVVTNADQLTDEEMVKIAREMNLSETAFVLQPTGEADVKLRFFTPAAAEIKFCGHATVGALFQLAQLSMFGLGKSGDNAVRVETNAGVLNMSVLNEKAQVPRVSFGAPAVKMERYHLQGNDFAEAFGVSQTLINTDGTILVDRELNYVYVPTSSLEALGRQTFDFTRVRKHFGDEGVVVFCFFSQETKEGNADLHARGLAPNVGVDEDPFTGSMQAGLVHAAKQNKYIPAEQTTVITEQGHFIGRPGFAVISHDLKTDTIVVTAQATPVFSARIELP